MLSLLKRTKKTEVPTVPDQEIDGTDLVKFDLAEAALEVPIPPPLTLKQELYVSVAHTEIFSRKLTRKIHTNFITDQKVSKEHDQQL